MEEGDNASCASDKPWRESELPTDEAAKLLRDNLGKLAILTAESQNFNGMTINKRVTEVESSIGAIVWNSYEALLQSTKQHRVDTYSTPFGKFC